MGVRSCKCKPEDDKYWGSSRHFNAWQKEHGRDGLEKNILAWWPSREQAIKHEMLLHEIFDVVKSNEFFNRSKQKVTGFDTAGTNLSVEHKNKIRFAHAGMKRSKETCEKISKSKIGKSRSDQTKQKLREVNIGKKRGPMSDEQKEIRSKMFTGRRWYNNGKDLVFCVEGQQPEGFVLGDPIRKKDFASGKKWFSNGLKEILVRPEDAPDGWVIGRLNTKGKQNGI